MEQPKVKPAPLPPPASVSAPVALDLVTGRPLPVKPAPARPADYRG